MRLSFLKNDPGYLPDANQYVVLLDGVEVKNVVTANEEGGAVRCRLDRSDETYVRRGKVEIIRRSGSDESKPSKAKFDRWKF